MNGNFTFHNPTRLHFGENAMEFLKDELAAFGPTVMLSYGGGSIKKNGIYDQVVAALKAAGTLPVPEAISFSVTPGRISSRICSRAFSAIRWAPVMASSTIRQSRNAPPAMFQ